MIPSVVDVHGHWFPPAVVSRRAPTLTPALAAAWELLVDVDAQLEHAAAAGTDVRVVSAPLSSIASSGVVPPHELAARTNEALAAEVSRHDGRLVALATVDAFAGDAGAEEARRAVDDLGLPGLVVDAARGERLLADPEARPTLAFAAERGIPVFAHPVNPTIIPDRQRRTGAGILLARGSESALSTLALLEAGTLAELAGLELIIAGIGASALLLAGFLDGPESGSAPPSAGRSRLHVDTMGFDPAVVRFLVDVLGPERVLVGSDWPIMWREASAARVEDTLAEAGLGARDAALVGGGNASRLLALPAPAGRQISA
jgi:predicted TIM-barrel fold metal-dependent hydrolase